MPISTPTHPLRTISRYMLMISGAALLGGCAQMKSPGYYDLPRESTTTDAIRQAETGGTLRVVQAPSQIQIKLNNTDVTKQASTSAPAAVAAPGAALAPALTVAGQQANTTAEKEVTTLNELVPQAQTYHGTLPCFYKEMRCTIQKFTLSLAPNGRWRARSEYLEQDADSGKPFVTQGCWTIVPSQPPSLMVMDNKGNVRADLQFLSRNSLRVKTIDGDSPNLNYTLNRQPDLDPIAELDKTTPPNCN